MNYYCEKCKEYFRPPLYCIHYYHPEAPVLRQPEWDNNDYSRDFVWFGITRKRDKQMKTYEVSAAVVAQIENNFTYHSLKNDQSDRCVLFRDAARSLAHNIITFTPSSREQALALTNLEQAIFWVNAAIARNE